MGIVRMGPPEDIVFFLQNIAGINSFIETGTYFGDTTSWASKHFSNVISIELSEKYFSLAQEKFKGTTNINLHYGDSGQVLKELLPKLPSAAIFWLDAHFCCDGAGKGDPAPILDEINTIYTVSKEHILLIDDARLFLSPAPKSDINEYPDACGLFATLKMTGNPYIVIHDDVLICVPQKHKEKLFKFFQTEVYITPSYADNTVKTIPASPKNPVRLRTLIKNILPFFIVERYRRNRKVAPPPKTHLEKFMEAFNEKADILTDGRFSCTVEDIYPCLDDKTANTEFNAHYTYHPAWASRVLAKTKPKEHIDIGSSVRFIAYVSAFVHIRFYDYRPAFMNLSNMETGFADITKLPFDDNSVESLSSMHVVEHIGLERYGDPFDPQGDLKAINELQRVLKPQGNLLFVVPVGGAMRIQYNAHRIYTYQSIVSYFNKLKLVSFALITDDAQYLENSDATTANKQIFGCGCFWFTKETV